MRRTLQATIDGVDLRHLGIPEVRSIITAEEWVEFYKFAIVRNPWDRMVSEYFWRTHRQDLPELYSFEHFVEEVHRGFDFGFRMEHLKPQVDYVFEPGRQASPLDFVGRFEHLQEAWDTISAQLALAPGLLVARNRERRGYQQYYNNETRDIVAEIYRSDVEAFGYEFS